MDIDRMLNLPGTTKELVSTKKFGFRRKADRRRKRKKADKKKDIEAHVETFEVIAEFVKAATG